MSTLLGLSRTTFLWLLVLAVALTAAALIGLFIARVVWMPERSFEGSLPEMTADQARGSARLKHDLTILAGEIGERNLFRPEAYQRAADFIAAQLTEAGYPVVRYPYDVNGVTCFNISAEKRGTARPDEIIVLGAHYDTVYGCPGANDNGTGVVALLELARALREIPTERTIRFVAFANEEPPWFQTAHMGSYVYARACRRRNDRIVGMLSLETLGCYSDLPNSQQYPPPFDWLYPTCGNFVAFVGNDASRA